MPDINVLRYLIDNKQLRFVPAIDSGSATMGIYLTREGAESVKLYIHTIPCTPEDQPHVFSRLKLGEYSYFAKLEDVVALAGGYSRLDALLKSARTPRIECNDTARAQAR